MSNIEQTLSIIKPDAVERNLDEKIKSIFIKEGFKIVKPLFLNISLISFSIFLSTASGFIIDKVCSTLFIIVFY